MSKAEELFRNYNKESRDWLEIGTPWITNDAVAWLEANILPSDVVLEIGSGRSTVWWASRVQSIHSLETSPEWMIYLSLFLYENPHLLRKVRMTYIPSDWHPGWKNGRKDYWVKNEASLNYRDITNLEKDYLSTLARLAEKGGTILSIDGGMRGYAMVLLHKRGLFRDFEIIVVDNTESRFHSIYMGDALGDEFKRLDFILGHIRPSIMSPHKRHVTSIFVRKDRLDKCVDVKTENKYFWDENELSKHQDFIPDAKSRKIVSEYSLHLCRSLIDYGLIETRK